MTGTQYVGLDVHKRSISVAVVGEARDNSVRFLGDFENTPESVKKLCKKLERNSGSLDFCYEASCCGYGIYRQLIEAGHECLVAAPSRIAKAAGDRIKTDRRDAQRLAVLHRAGDLVRVWVPDTGHEAMRDLTRARVDASQQLQRARQQLLGFLLRHGRTYDAGVKHWTFRHRRWLSEQSFSEPAQNIVFHDYLEAIWAAVERRDTLINQIEELVPDWSLGDLTAALCCVRGLGLVSAATFLACVGDLSRFDNPRQLMGYLGLVPSEHSSGERIHRGGITKTGNREARRMLIEASWSYRYPARVGIHKVKLLEKQPKPVREIAQKTQVRLCKRYRQLTARGKKSVIVVTAVARELSGFIWAMGQEIRPRSI